MLIAEEYKRKVVSVLVLIVCCHDHLSVTVKVAHNQIKNYDIEAHSSGRAYMVDTSAVSY
jgi:hypothetical protein